jgi:peptide-methionine (R)-S-oxide reductase
MIQAANGAWEDEQRSSRGLSNPADLEWLIANRAVSDAVVVSAKTAMAENYGPLKHRSEYLELRRKHGLRENAKLVCITSNPARIDAVLKYADLVLSTSSHADNRVIQIGNTGSEFFSKAIEQLNLRGLIRLVWEGGPGLIDALVEENQLHQFALSKSKVNGPAGNQYRHVTEFLEHKPITFQEVIDGVEFQLVGSLPTWQEILPSHNYAILRKSYTEPAFSVPYEKSPAEGFYSCGACGNRLFEASSQFDARCGWPAFWQPSAMDQVKLIEDLSHGMRRVEVVCSACESHLGHVFYGEGFGFPGDARYCINAGALKRH